MLGRDARFRSSESGLIGVGAVIGLAIAGLGIYLLFAAFEGDPDYYGTVAVPSGQAATEIELDGGEVEISYAEDVGTDSLEVPDDLVFAVRTKGGEVLDDSLLNGSPEESDVGAAELIAAVDVPEDGTYFVSAESGLASTRLQPALAFGLSPTGAVRVRFGEVVEELSGPTGIIVLVALGLLFLIPRVHGAYKRRQRDRTETYS